MSISPINLFQGPNFFSTAAIVLNFFLKLLCHSQKKTTHTCDGYNNRFCTLQSVPELFFNKKCAPIVPYIAIRVTIKI